ncbi:MAG: DNA polymerase IV [Solobacterium sp.]|jgi:DNA polymerase-4|nr:DNA polymerase IV [Solobacterium sp.]MCH4223186.1 DNA polymerase IV [Solobacterium sp.]MCH4266034.1 DNA polymerase IV [Solobacterium sp.]
MSRVYFHIDLNAFYANAECLLDPGLKGKPIAVAGETRRSVVSTASYEAREFGVHSAMPVSEAAQRCPQLILVEPHFHYYSSLSQQFIAIVRSYTDEIEQASVDECYADMTDAIMKYAHPLDLAWKIQHQILNELGLPCSIGVGPNMFLAKMASDMKKPMGITVLRIREAETKLWPLAIGEMRGVGNKTVPLLEELGIHTIGDLANFKDVESLRPIFGKNTEMMIRRAHGYDDRTIVKEADSKSMGVSETFLEDVTDYDEIRGYFREMSRKLSGRLRRENKIGSLVSIRIKYYDFQIADRSRKLPQPIYKADDLFVQAMDLFDANWEGDPVRLTGLSLSDFASDEAAAVQINLFDPVDEQREETDKIMKDLNKELSSGIKLKRASAMLKDHN